MVHEFARQNREKRKGNLGQVEPVKAKVSETGVWMFLGNLEHGQKGTWKQHLEGPEMKNEQNWNRSKEVVVKASMGKEGRKRGSFSCTKQFWRVTKLTARENVDETSWNLRFHGQDTEMVTRGY